MSRSQDPDGVIARLFDLIEARAGADPQHSYVARLRGAGIDAVLTKIGEESTELVLAAKAGGRAELIHEAADLWFHTLVALSVRGVRPEEVLAELERRLGRSGIEEKASRGLP